MPLGDFVIEAVEAVAEFGGPGVNRPRFEAALLNIGGVAGSGGAAIVPGVVTAFDEGSWSVDIDTVIDGDAVSATDVPYLGIAVPEVGDDVMVAVLVAPTEDPGEYVVLGLTRPQSSSDIICTDPGVG